jgi:hypothetical protein
VGKGEETACALSRLRAFEARLKKISVCRRERVFEERESNEENVFSTESEFQLPTQTLWQFDVRTGH